MKSDVRNPFNPFLTRLNVFARNFNFVFKWVRSIRGVLYRKCPHSLRTEPAVCMSPLRRSNRILKICLLPFDNVKTILSLNILSHLTPGRWRKALADLPVRVLQRR